jgi:hypothetical protein
MHLALLYLIERNSFEESNKDELWKRAMDEELDQIEKNDTWNWYQDQGTRMLSAQSGSSKIN